MRRAPLVIGGLVVAVLVVLGVRYATRDEEPAAPAAASTPVAAPAPAPPREDITHVVDASPQAEVYAIDGRLLGTTPYSQRRAPAEGRVVFVLRRTGHQEQRVELPADASASRTVQLQVVEPPAPPEPTAATTAPPATKNPPPRPKGRVKPAERPPIKPGDIVID
jgi:hypothetical protein